MKLLLLVLFIGLTFGCTANTHRFSTLDEIHETVQVNRSTLPAYDLTGGVWVKGQPILINHEFDFSMAMSLPDIGPAIAAGNRKKVNEETAKLFENLPALSLEALFQKSLDRSGLKVPRDKEVRLYGILLGQPDAHLRVILEMQENKVKTKAEEDLKRFVYVTEWIPLKGDDSWSASGGQKIIEVFGKAIPSLIEMWQSNLSRDEQSREVDYIITKGKVPQKGSGWVLAKNNKRILIRSGILRDSILSYPASVIEIQNQ